MTLHLVVLRALIAVEGTLSARKTLLLSRSLPPHQLAALFASLFLVNLDYVSVGQSRSSTRLACSYADMGKYYCDYCDVSPAENPVSPVFHTQTPSPCRSQVFLTHDSSSVRRAHNSGRNHLSNVRDYYASAFNSAAPLCSKPDLAN